MSLSTIPSVGVVFVQSEYCYYLSIVVEEFAGLVQDKSSVEDFVLWIENILERCIRKVRSCFTPTYISKHGYLQRVLRKCLLLTKVDVVSYPVPPSTLQEGGLGMRLR